MFVNVSYVGMCLEDILRGDGQAMLRSKAVNGITERNLVACLRKSWWAGAGSFGV